MTNFIKTQNSFAHGEISPEFFAHDNINGLSVLENMDVIAGGGITRRKGLQTIDTIGEDARLFPLSVSENENYLLVIMDERMYIYANGQKKQDMIAPWTIEDVPKLQYAQRFGTMMFVHPNYSPYILEKKSNRFVLSQFNFGIDENGFSAIPKMKFDDARGISITITDSDQGNVFATLTTDEDFWTPDNYGTRIYMNNKEWIIKNYISERQVTAFLGETFIPPVSPVTDWSESAFSNRRGWPACISFHQDRLVFAATPSYPSGIWMSKVGVHDDFSAGTGLDDEAISLTLLSQQRQQICTLVSSDSLQVLTTAGEWAISNAPLTPSNVSIKQHTSIGSVATHYLPPQQIEGKTVFVSNTQKDIRELELDDLGVKYNANDLCPFSKHLLGNITGLAYNQDTRQLFVVLNDGTLSVLNYNSGLGISAWAHYTTNGEFLSVAVTGDDTYAMVKRDDDYMLEMFSGAKLNDAGTFDFNFDASALPLRSSGHEIMKWRLRKISARVMNTKSISINGSRVTLPNDVYNVTADGFTGDVSVDILGTNDDYTAPVWRIHGTDALPITVLSVTIYGRYSI